MKARHLNRLVPEGDTLTCPAMRHSLEQMRLCEVKSFEISQMSPTVSTDGLLKVGKGY